MNIRQNISVILCGVLLTCMVASVQAQKPRINTHDASIPHATKTTKSNLRKAGGKISKASRRTGKAISQASRNVQKQVSRTFHEKP